MYSQFLSIMKLIIISLLMLIPLVYTSSSMSNLEKMHSAIMGTALQTVVLGESIELQCPLKIWYPMAQFNWNPPLPRLGTGDSGYMQLTNITFTNLGDYRCSVREQEDIIFLIKIQSKPIIEMELGESTVRRAKIGQNVELQCKAYGSPMPNVSWQRVSSASSIRTFSQGKIGDSSDVAHAIDCLSIPDIGYYICQATNSIGKAEKRVQVVIDSDSKMKIPGVAVQYVEIGSSLELHCPLIQKYPKCNIYWKQQNSHLQRDHENYCDHNLFISNISFSNGHNQKVSCSLTNDSQPAPTFEFRIIPISELNVTITPWESGVVSRRIGDQVTLECIAFGSPESTVMWQKLLSTSSDLMSHQQIDIKSSHAVYNITCLSIANIGYYTCEAENSFQKAEKRVHIVIESDRNMRILGVAVQYVEIGSSLELHCPLIQKYPKCNIYWKQQNSHLQRDHENYCDHNLFISNISFSNGDNQKVSCSLTNDSQPAPTFEFRIIPISKLNVTITPWESGVVSRRIGDQVTLECIAFGSPEPTVIWQKLSSTSTALMSHKQKDTNSPHAVYNITCLSVANIGDYLCEAENSLQKAEKRVQLVLDRESKMEIQGILVHYVEIGGSLELHCPLIQKYPECNIYWKQQNSHLQRDQDEYRDYNLLINNISLGNGDHRRVSCSLTNDSQPAPTFEFRIVLISELNVTVTPWESGVVSRKIGDQVTLECIAFGSPQPTVIWQELSSPSTALMSHKQEDTNSPHAVHNITCLSVTNIGYYTCEAENSLQKAEKRVQLVLDRDSKMEIPGIVVHYVEIGGSLELHCPLIQKYPECKIYWKQQNSHLQRDQVVYRDHNLFISNISFSNGDNQKVSCSLTNDSQPAPTFEFRIVLISELNVTVTPWESGVVSRRIGDQVTLECIAFGSPESTVMWQKLLSTSSDLMSHQQIDIKSSHAVYNITCLSIANIGYYTCEAENSFQKAEKRVHIVIESDRNMRILGVAVQYVEIGSSLELHCPLIQKYPKCNIYWKQQNSHLQRDHENYCDHNLFISNISFSNGDNQKVSCSLTNDSQPAPTFEFRIIPISKLNVTITPWESGVVSRRIGDQVTLECIAFGSPEPTVIWQKLSSTSTALMSHKQKDTNSPHAVYNITCLSVANIGDYLCEAENSLQKAEKRVQLVLDRESKMEIQGILVHYVEIGGSLELHCPLIQKYPECNIYWKQQNSHLQRDQDEYRDYNLLINNISLGNGDHRRVSCSLTNDSQPAPTFEFRIVLISELNVTVTPWESGVVSRKIGDQVTLECIAFGSPQPTVIWQELSSPSTALMSHKQEDTNSPHAVHNITCLSVTNIGYYTCEAENSLQKAEKRVQLVLDRDSKMEIPGIVVHYVEIGGSLELHCPLIQKYPECKIYWKQQNSHLQRDQVVYRDHNLFISNISFSNGDNQKVSCSLTNDSQPAPTFEFRIVLISELNVTVTPWESGVVSRKIGDQVTLECIAFGSPEPNVIWQKLSSTSTALISHKHEGTNSPHAVYNITCLSAANIGYYTCEAENSLQKAEKRVQLALDRDSKMEIQGIIVHYVEIGGSLELHCPLIQKYPECNIYWKQQNSHLQRDHHNYRDYNLLISNISFSNGDNQKVSCSLTNDSQPAPTFEFQIVLISELNVTVTPWESGVVSRKIGDQVTLECIAFGSPEPNVIWQKLSSTSTALISHKHEGTNSPHAVYNITCLSVANIGYYTCEAENSLQKTEKRVQLALDRDSKMEIQGIIVHYVEIGGSLELHCPLIQKYPECNIYWKQQNSHLQRDHENYCDHNLFISNISFSNGDNQKVSCSLTNDSQPAPTFEFRIVLISELNVTVTPWESGVVSRKIGDQVTLECIAFGSPEPTVIWQKLSSTSTALMSHKQKDTNSPHAVYNITCLSVANIGDYLCEAENSLQKAEKRVQLVLDRDSKMEIQGIIVHYVEIGDSLELHCPLIQKYPECNIYWKQQNSHLQRDQDEYRDHNLFISNISFSNGDNQKVSCSLTNDSQPAPTFEFRIVLISELNVTVTPWESGVVSRKIGDQVTLECIVFGSPEPTVIWQKLSSTSTALMSHKQKDTNSRHAVYNITCLSIANIGDYLCEAENSLQKAEKRVQLVIDRDSKMEIQGIIIHYVEIGGSLELHCPLIQKYPECNIYWKQQNSHLQRDQDVYRDHNLFISNISFSNGDNQKVSCSLTNDSQPAPTFEFRIVLISELNVTVTPWESGVVSRKIGDQVTLECIVFGSPEPTVIWQKLSSTSTALMSHKQKDTNSRHAVYNITCLSVANIGDYLCEAENSLQKAEKRVQLVIDRDSKMEIQGIIIHYVEIGGSLELYCPLIQKYPECNIYWKQQNSHLQRDQDVYRDHNLFISNISFSNGDNQKVSCSLTNDSQPAPTFEFRIVLISELNVTVTPWESGVVSRKIGDQVTLECIVFGSPEPTVIWQKLSSTSTALMSHKQKDTNSRHAVYNITCLSVANIGDYLCEAENSLQKAEKRVQLVIDRDSKMEIQGIIIHYVEIGGSLELYCPLIQKYPECNIYWKQQNSHLQRDQDVYRDHNLFISNISFSNGDNQKVSCSLTNDSQPAPTFEFRIVLISELNVTVTPWESGVVSRKIGDQVTLECIAFGSPEPTVIWQKLSSTSTALMSHKQKDTNSPHAVYNITCLSVANIGDYLCEAENSLQKAEKRVQLVLDRDSKMEIQGIIVHYVEIGGSLELHCPLIQKYPECNIYWKQQNSHLQRDHHNYRDYNLLISNISFSNEDYKRVSCSLTNDSQPAPTFIFQIVRTSKPHITITPREDGKVYVQQCGNLSLLCSASGHPEPTIIWTNSVSKSLIYRSPPLINTTSSSMREYEIPCISRKHEGTYTCQASTLTGNVTDSVQIIVDRSRPGSVLALSKRNLKIECGATVEIVCQINDCCAVDLNLMWVRMNHPLLPPQSTANASILRINNFTFESEGQYSCVALDSSGVELYRTTTMLELQSSSVRMWTNRRPEIGEDVSAYCTVCGAQVLSVKWNFERELPCNVEISKTELYITKFGPGNNGMYTCTVKTTGGSVSQVGFLSAGN